MHQQQLITFADKFGLLSSYPKKTPPREFRNEDEYGTQYALLPPVKARHYQLSGIQIKHLQQHYRTMYSIPSLQDPQLMGVDTCVQVWYRCHVDKTIFHCAQSRRRNSSRLNHLVCLRQDIDANANFREGTRPEHMVAEYFYAYVQFYCVHHFRERVHMLMYSSYRNVNVHDGLVEDKGHWLDGFQDISVLENLCAKVTREDGKTFFVETPERMEERLRKVLGA
jgi:hypothetical protein